MGRGLGKGRWSWRLDRRTGTEFQDVRLIYEATGAATSAKMLDTRALSYVDLPSRIFAQLGVFVDKVDRFADPERTKFPLPVAEIYARRLELVVPFETTPEQIIQIQRIIEYAEGLGIDMGVSFIR